MTGKTAGTRSVYQIAHGNQIVQAVNSVVAVVGGEQVPLLATPTRRRLGPGASAARLLRGRSTVVGFVDRSARLKELTRWAGSGVPFAVTVLGGGGGTGKTRLGVELCLTLTESPRSAGEASGWVCGFLDPDAPAGAIHGLGSLRAPRLVVVDYAETRTPQLSGLLPALAARATEQAPVRIVLLIRRPAPPRPAKATTPGQVWVDAVRGDDEAADMLLDQADVLILDQDTLVSVERKAVFAAAYDAFHPEVEERGRPDPTVPDLAGGLYDQPLMVVMAAYLTARDPDRVLPETAEGMFDAILEHENHYWEKTWAREKLEFSLWKPAFRQAAALATLTDSRDADEALALLLQVPAFKQRSEWKVRQVDAWLTRLYPAVPGGGESSRWGSLEPDRVGEHLLSVTLLHHPNVLTAVLDPERAPELLTRPMTTLARVADDGGNSRDAVTTVAAGQLPGLVQRALAEASDSERYAAGTIRMPTGLAALVDVVCPGLDPHLAESLASYLPADRHVLAPLALALARAAVEGFGRLVIDDEQKKSNLARALTNYAVRLAEVGRREEALAHAAEAVKLRRDLVAGNPAAHTPNLAGALTNYANALGEVERREEALAHAAEAVKLCRNLVAGHPAAYTPDLARALTTYANALGEGGRRNKALAPAAEAVNIYRNLVAGHPAAYTPNLARALTNYANALSKVRHREEALAHAVEAVKLCRQLVAGNPAAYTPDLARALTTYAVGLRGVGRFEEAWPRAAEAVDVYRKLVAVNSAAYTPDLVRSLTNYAILLGEVGRREEAVAIRAEIARLA